MNKAEQSILVNLLSRFLEFGNKRFVLSSYIFKSDENIFHKLEGLIFIITLFCIGLWLWLDYIPVSISIVIAYLLIQRVIEFVIVYSRN